jgi:hypothetical protein
MINRSRWIIKKESPLDKKIDSLIQKTKTDEVQGRIRANIFFRYNSVNVVIGQRGSGKTHFVLREVLKLLQYPEVNYSTFLYSSNKISKDETVEKFAPLFANSLLKIDPISHDETNDIINNLAAAKVTYSEFKKMAGIPDKEDRVIKDEFTDYDKQNQINEQSLYDKIYSVPNIKTNNQRKRAPKYSTYDSADDSYNPDLSNTDTRERKEKFITEITTPQINNPILEKEKIILKNMPLELRNHNLEDKYVETLQQLNLLDLHRNVPHTIIFIDDCIDLLSRRGELFKKLFENRQSKITYFLGLQDVQGIPSSMKSNMDSLTLFGGFSKQKFNSLFYQIPMDDDREAVYYEYRMLLKNERMMISFETKGIQKYIVRAGK